MISPEDVLPVIQDCGYEPREYQARIISKTCNSFLNGCKSILIESPTGSGKTSMSLIALKILQRVQPAKIGWIAMRRKLLKQAEQENEKIGVENIRFISMFDRNPPKVDIMTIDEGHHDSAATCANLHKIMEPKWCLSMTATPFRTDRVKLSFEKTIRDCGIRFLIEQGYLSPFDQYVIPRWTPKEIAKRFLACPEKWGKSIIFMKDKDLCMELQDRLINGGVSAETMVGTDTISQRDRMFSDFEEGYIQVLINVYLLTEGFDCEDLRSVWIRDSGKLCVLQMGGRGLRKDPNDPGKVANMVQSENTWCPYTRLAKARKQFVLVEDRWMALQPGVTVETILEKVQKKVLTKQVLLPKYLLDKTNRIVSLRVNRRGEVNVNRSQSRQNQVWEDLMG